MHLSRATCALVAFFGLSVSSTFAFAQSADDLIAKIQEYSQVCVNGKGAEAIDKCSRLINVYSLPQSQKFEGNDLKLFVIYAVRGEHYHKNNDAIAACKDVKVALSMQLKSPQELHRKMTNDLQNVKRGCEAAGRW